MPMRATTVRFSEDLWELLEEEAAREGISAAQFVRDATIMRIAFLLSKRGDPQAEATIESIAAGALAGRRRGGGPGGGDEGLESGGDPLAAAVRNADRLAALRRTALLDAPPDEAFDRIATLAARVLDAPIALLTLVDEERQFFTACIGLGGPYGEARETPLSHSFCQHAVASREPLIVRDAREHPVLRDNLAIRDLGVIAYLGIPLVADGQPLGTLCVIDTQPRRWTREQVELMKDLAAIAAAELQARVPA